MDLKIHNKLLTRKEAAEYLRLQKSTLDAWAHRGGGPVFVKMGRACRYRLEDLEDFVNRNLVRNTAHA